MFRTVSIWIWISRVDGELRFKISQERRELLYYVLWISQVYSGMSRVWFTRFEQCWTKDEFIGLLREIVASTKRDFVGFFVTSGAAAILRHYMKKSFERTECGLLFLDDKHAVDILIFKYVWFHIMMNMKTRFWRDVFFQHWEGVIRNGRSKSSIDWEEDSKNNWIKFKNEDWMHCFPPRIQVMFLRSANIQANQLFRRDWWFITHKKWKMEVYTKKERTHEKGDTQSSTQSFIWIKHDINFLLRKLDWWQKKKNVKKGNMQFSFSNSIAGEAEALIGVKKPRGVNCQIHWKSDEKCRVLNSFVHDARRNFGRQSPSHHCVLASKVVRKRGDEIGSQDNYRDQNCRCEILTQF